MHISRLPYLSLSLLLLTAQSSFAQENSPSAQPAEVTAVANPENADESANSTVVYSSDFFSQYNPVTANDMLDRIPGISLGGGGPGGRGGGRGLGTGGNLLINGQRIAGKGNSATRSARSHHRSGSRAHRNHS